MDVSATLAGLRFGDHVCAPIRQGRELHAFAVAFARDGLQAGHKVFMAVTHPAPLREHLADRLPTAAGAVTAGQMEIIDSRDNYLGSGGFSPDRLIDRFHGLVDAAHRDGYPGLWVLGDLSGLIPDVPTEAIVDYEARVNRVYAQRSALAVCPYPPEVVGDQAWQQLAAAHPCALTTSGDAVVCRLRSEPTPAGLRLVGEADLTNHAAVPHLLSAVAGRRGGIELDLTAMTYADTASLVEVLRTATARAPRPTTVTCNSHHARVLTLLGAPAIPTLTVTTGGRQ